MTIIQTDRLSKTFDEFVALRDCTVQVSEGEVFGLLGPNGAGKSTLLRLLLGFLKPTSGSAKICDLDIVTQSQDVRRNVAYLPGDARLPGHMRGRSILKFFADLHPAGDFKRSLAVAEQLQLDMRRHVGFMSTGMRQKLALSVVLSTRCPIVILDEPTANLDPTVRAAVLDHVLETQREGRTVVFSSHVLSEIQQVCDRVVFLRQGNLVLEQSMRDLKDRHRIVLTGTTQSPTVPDAIADRVVVDATADGYPRLAITGDISPVLSWLATMNLQDLKLEPLGIDAIYEQVHAGTIKSAAETLQMETGK